MLEGRTLNVLAARIENRIEGDGGVGRREEIRNVDILVFLLFFFRFLGFARNDIIVTFRFLGFARNDIFFTLRLSLLLFQPRPRLCTPRKTLMAKTLDFRL